MSELRAGSGGERLETKGSHSLQLN